MWIDTGTLCLAVCRERWWSVCTAVAGDALDDTHTQHTL